MPSPAPPSLPKNTGDRARLTLRRALTRRCPYCGSPGIYDGYFAPCDAGPRCGTVFEREEGYLLGAYAINLIVAETLGLMLAIVAIFGTGLRDADVIWQIVVAVAIVVTLPVVFFPYARGFWMAMDLTFHPPQDSVERQLRGVQPERDSRKTGAQNTCGADEGGISSSFEERTRNERILRPLRVTRRPHIASANVARRSRAAVQIAGNDPADVVFSGGE